MDKESTVDKKSAIQLLIATILFIAVTVLVFGFIFSEKKTFELVVVYGENHLEDTVQLFYAPIGEIFSEDMKAEASLAGKKANLKIGIDDIENNHYRIDPFNRIEGFTIKKIVVKNHGIPVGNFSASEINDQICYSQDMGYSLENDYLNCFSTTEDPFFMLSDDFSAKANDMITDFKSILFISLVGVYIIFGIILIVKSRGCKDAIGCAKHCKAYYYGYGILAVVASVLTTLGLVLVYALNFMQKQFGDVPLGQLLYHLHTPLDGTNVSTFSENIEIGVRIAIVSIILEIIFFIIACKNKKLSLGAVHALGLSVLILVYDMMTALVHFDFVNYYKYTHQNSSLYGEYYVDARDVELSFSEQKCNLIYFFLESMEVTYADETDGGGDGK